MKADKFAKVWEKFNLLFASYQSFSDEIKAEKLEIGEAVTDNDGQPVADGEYILGDVKIETKSSVITKIEAIEPDDLEKDEPQVEPEAEPVEEPKEDLQCGNKDNNEAEEPTEEPKEETEELACAKKDDNEEQEVESAETTVEAAPAENEDLIAKLTEAVGVLTEAVKDLNARVTKIEGLGAQPVKEAFKKNDQRTDLLRYAFGK